MKRTVVCHVIVLWGVLLLSSCSQIGISGRQQFNLMPDSVMNSMSFQSYNEFLSQHKLSTDVQHSQMVAQVGRRIQKAVEHYCDQNGKRDLLAGYQWEFNLVEDASVNAWCMPGGKVVVYTGLLPVAETETGLAVVMGHEIAHAFAKHGAERMTQGLMVEMGGTALSAALSESPEQTQTLLMQSYGIGTQVGLMLPYSRVHETEADHLGLVFMAMAGYNPEEAVTFWQRMAASKEGQAQPLEILSTHPLDTTRISHLKEYLPEAMTYYRVSQASALSQE